MWSLSLAVLETRAESETSRSQRPDVLVTILASNEEHLLSTFFGGFERLNYPKENIGNFNNYIIINSSLRSVFGLPLLMYLTHGFISIDH